MRFLIIEYPEVTPLAKLTGQRPGLRIDVLGEALYLRGDERIRPAVLMFSGALPGEIPQLVAMLESQYGPPEPLRRDLRAGEWIGRIHIPESALKDTVSMRVLRFQDRFGIPWVHVEGGVVHMRTRIPDGADAQGLAATVQAELQRIMPAGTPLGAQVEVRELGDRDYGVWAGVIQHTLGLPT